MGGAIKMTEEKMTEEEKGKWLHIKDLEAELDYYGLYEPKDRASMHKLEDEIEDCYEELGFPKKLPTPLKGEGNPLEKLKKILSDD